MRKITFLFSFIALTIAGLGIYSCQKGEDRNEPLIEQNYSEDFTIVGEKFAQKIRKIVTEKQKLPKTASFERKVATTLEKESDFILKFTEQQLKIFSKIALAKQESKSYIAFSNKLSEINKEILTLPKSEQNDLFYITSTLYYGLKEINEMAKEGIITGKPEGIGNGLTLARLEKRPIMANSENGNSESNNNEGSWWSNQAWLGAIWTIAIAEPTPVGEAVAGVITGAVAGYYAITRAECISKYVDCRTYDSPKKDCSSCLRYCITQGNWNCG